MGGGVSIVGILVVLAMQFLGGGGGDLGGALGALEGTQTGGQGATSEPLEGCETGVTCEAKFRATAWVKAPDALAPSIARALKPPRSSEG